jgi:hypothetical protein
MLVSTPFSLNLANNKTHTRQMAYLKTGHLTLCSFSDFVNLNPTIGWPA